MASWEPVNGVFTASASWLPAMDFWDKFEWFPFIMTAAAAFITALVGAWFGASAAQKIAKKAKRIDELTAEIRAVNSGITLGLTILNTALSSKKQYIKPISERYEVERRNFIAFLENGRTDEAIVIDQLKFPHLALPIEDLQQLVMQKISSSAFALRAVLALADRWAMLGEAIKVRNNCLDRLTRRELPPGYSVPDLYFGLTTATGRNNEYRSALEAIGECNDDVIFFSLKLCRDLHAHGESLKDEFKSMSDDPVGIIVVGGDKAYEMGLIPPEKNYEDWLAGYSEVREPKPTRKWWHRRRK